MIKKLTIILSVALFAVIALQAKDKNPDFQKALEEQGSDQKKCSEPNVSLSGAEREAFVKYQEKLIKLPENKNFVGDYTNGVNLFKNGQLGNCQACHCGESSAYVCGNVGPALTNYKKNGMSAEFVYKKIYNSWVAVPCSSMPRFGVNGLLSVDDVKDIVAYLMDDRSAINTEKK